VRRSGGGPATTPRLPRAQSAFAVPNVRLYLAGQGLSNIGTFFQVVGLTLLVLKITGSGFALGATLSLGAVPFLLFAPWAGTIIDRVDIRRLLLTTSTLAGLQALALALLIATGAINFWWIAALTLLVGLVQTFDRPAAQAFLSELVPATQLPSAVALASSAQSVGRLGGPAIAAIVYASFGPAWCFGINAASYLAVVAALLLLRRSAMLPRAPRRHATGQLRAGLSFIWRSPLHRGPLIANAVIGCLAFNFPLFYASITTQDFHGGALAFGIAESLNAVTAVLAGLYLTRSPRTPTRRGFALGAAALGISLGWSALAPTLWLFYAGMLYFGAAVVYYSTTSQALVQQNTPPEMVGRVMSIYMLGIMGTTPIGGLIVGFVIDAIDPRAALALGAASALLCAVVVLLQLRRTGNEPVAARTA
jgi:MFS family permease